jgi:hypothetical protein
MIPIMPFECGVNLSRGMLGKILYGVDRKSGIAL